MHLLSINQLSSRHFGIFCRRIQQIESFKTSLASKVVWRSQSFHVMTLLNEPSKVIQMLPGLLYLWLLYVIG